MSTLLRSVTAEGTADDEDSRRQTANSADDDGGRSWRRRAVLAIGGLVAVLAYRRLRGGDGRETDAADSADSTSVDDSGTGTTVRRTLKRRLGGRVTRLVVGFVAASAAKRLLRRWQR